jgi:hypothetical protein
MIENIINKLNSGWLQVLGIPSYVFGLITFDFVKQVILFTLGVIFMIVKIISYCLDVQKKNLSMMRSANFS